MQTRQISYNRYALYEYTVIEKYEAGIVLEGAEVKQLRAGNCNLRDSFSKTCISPFTTRRARSTRAIPSVTESC